MNNFPILEAAANHIEINGQMYEFPVCVRLSEYYLVKLLAHDSIIKVSNYDHAASVETIVLKGHNKLAKGSIKPELGDTTIIPDTEFQRAFQDVFFKLAQIAEGK
jgi:hypothetical protein